MTEWMTIIKPAKGDIRAITPVIGTATAVLTEVVDLDLRWMSDCTIVIGNAHATESLDYSVKVFSDYNLGVSFETTSGAVAAGDSDQVILKRHAKATVSVKRTAAADSTYNISCIAGR